MARAQQPSQLVAGVPQLLGEPRELDPLFLEDCWTVGAAAAMENWRRREQARVVEDRQNLAFRELDRFLTIPVNINFVEASEPAAESLLADRAAKVASRYNANSSQRQTAFAQDQPAQRWATQDPIAQRWMPNGLGQIEQPEAVAAASPSWAAEPESCIARPEPLTEARACVLLDTAPASTREQLRTAYCRMVIRWHPDHLQLASEEVRQYATQQMATINLAYSLLRASLDLRADQDLSAAA